VARPVGVSAGPSPAARVEVTVKLLSTISTPTGIFGAAWVPGGTDHYREISEPMRESFLAAEGVALTEKRTRREIEALEYSWDTEDGVSVVTLLGMPFERSAVIDLLRDMGVRQGWVVSLGRFDTTGTKGEPAPALILSCRGKYAVIASRRVPVATS
jgi:hypothetical protein